MKKKSKMKVIYLPVFLAALIIFLVATLFRQNFDIREKAKGNPHVTINPFPTSNPKRTPKPKRTPVPSLTPAPTATPSTPPTSTPIAIQKKRVFVTSNTYSGRLGGLDGADYKCQLSAKGAGLSGTYKAWLSTITISAESRLTHSSGPYQLTNGRNIANNWTDLTDGYLLSPIDVTEFGSILPNKYENVWTSTSRNGGIYSLVGYGQFDCQDWKSELTDHKGGIGSTYSVSPSWTESGFGYCQQLEHLFCFEQ